MFRSLVSHVRAYPRPQTSLFCLFGANLKNLYSVLPTYSGDGITDAFLAVGGGEDVVDAGLDLLDRVEVAAVRHRLWEIMRVKVTVVMVAWSFKLANHKAPLWHEDIYINTKINYYHDYKMVKNNESYANYWKQCKTIEQQNDKNCSYGWSDSGSSTARWCCSWSSQPCLDLVMMMIGLMVFKQMIHTKTKETQSCFNTRSALDKVTRQKRKQIIQQNPDTMTRLTGLAEAKAAKQATARRAKAVWQCQEIIQQSSRWWSSYFFEEEKNSAYLHFDVDRYVWGWQRLEGFILILSYHSCVLTRTVTHFLSFIICSVFQTIIISISHFYLESILHNMESI